MKETQVQEKTLDAIGDALDDMRRMGQARLPALSLSMTSTA